MKRFWLLGLGLVAISPTAILLCALSVFFRDLIRDPGIMTENSFWPVPFAIAIVSLASG